MTPDARRPRPLGPLSFLPAPMLEPKRPLVAIPIAWLTALVPSLLLAGLVTTLLPASGQPQFAVDGTLAVFLLVVFAPIVETLIMGGVLLLLGWAAGPVAAVLISSLGWGIAHSLAAPAWGLVIWWPFLIFSTLFVVWRRRSLALAFAVPALVHGLHNLPSALLLAYGNG